VASSKVKDEVGRDNQTAPPVADNGEWERVKVGLGEGWDWTNNPTLIGTWTGAEVVELKEPGLDGRSEATAYIFVTDEGEQVFLWQSYALTAALENCGVGDRLKIVYKGQQDIKDGKQRINRFDVFRAAMQQSLPQDYGDTNPLDEV
jgi:hypothetical protein